MGDRSIHVKLKHLCRILRGDLAALILRGLGKEPIDKRFRMRPGGLGVRKVVAPNHVIHPDKLAQLDADFVFHKLYEHIAVPVIAG